MVASATEIISLQEMKQQLDFDDQGEDDTYDELVLEALEAALQTVDKLVRFDLLDQTIELEIPYPGNAPIELRVANLHSHQETPDPPTIKYWHANEVNYDETQPIAAPTGTITPTWIRNIKGRVLLYPPAIGWPALPTRYRRLLVTYQVGMRSSEVPVAIKQAIVLLTRKIYNREPTNGPNMVWYTLIGPYRNMRV